MKKLFALVFFFLQLFVASANPAHEFHASIAEVKYNPHSKSFEVGVRFFTEDLAAVLSKQAGTKIRIDKNPDTESLIAKYTSGSFQLVSQNGNPMMCNYIGFENEGELTWVYMEMPAANFNIETLNVRYISLFDYFADQVNTVNVFYHDKVSTLVFRAAEQADMLPVKFMNNR